MGDVGGRARDGGGVTKQFSHIAQARHRAARANSRHVLFTLKHNQKIKLRLFSHTFVDWINLLPSHFGSLYFAQSSLHDALQSISAFPAARLKLCRYDKTRHSHILTMQYIAF